MGVLRALAVLLLLAAPAAAQNTWTGGSVGDWHDPANWSAGVPTGGDNVLIDADALVIAYATSPAVSLSQLALGDAAQTFAPTLRLGRGAALGVATLYGRAALQLDTTDLMSASDLYLLQGSSVAAWLGPTAAGGGASRWAVSGTFSLAAGSTMTVKGHGYAPDSGPGLGQPGSVSAAGGGAGHGGAGGQGGGPSPGGPAYGALSSATFAGSGGGTTPSASGGAGGGVIAIVASTAALDGLLDADGEAGESVGFEGGGAGAGGSIRVDAAVLMGGGVLSARGGAGGAGANFGGGGAGGGRVEVRVASSGDLSVASATVRLNGGVFGAGATFGVSGTAGTQYATPRHWTRNGANSLASLGANWSLGGAPQSGERVVWGSSETARLCSWDLPDVFVGSATVLAAYSTSVVLGSSLTVTGAFDMAGGTIAVSLGNRALDLRGPSTQTGGLINLVGSTVALRGGVYDFFEQRATELVIGGLGATTATLRGNWDVRGMVNLSAGAHLDLSSGTLKLASVTGPFAGPGTVQGSTSHVTQASAALPQLWTTLPGTLGSLRVSNASGGLALSTSTVSVFRMEGGVMVDTGAVFSATATFLRVGGDWTAYGGVYLARSTVTFDAQAGTQTLVSGGLAFESLVIAPAAGATTLFSSMVVVNSTLTVASGTLDLGKSTSVVKGGWLQQGGAVFGNGGKTIFDGSAPTYVTQLGGSSFGALISSTVGTLYVTSTVVTRMDFQWVRGGLDIAGRDVFVGGDFVNGSAGTLSAFLSTVTLNGANFQTMNFPVLHGLVIDNRSAAGARIALNTTVSSFTIRPGASFDGFNRSLVVSGSVFDTAGSTYNSLAQLHTVTWLPGSGTLYVAAGSVVNGKVILFNGRTAQLAGDLTFLGAGNTFDPRSGSSVLNAPGGSTITFKGSSDLIPTAGANWTYGGNVADSWLVFEGTGLARGLFMSTNTLGSLRLSMTTATDTYRAPDMTLLKHLVVEAGSFKPNGAKTITLGGDLIQVASGVVTFASTGTLRLVGPSTQTLRMIPSSHTLLYVSLESTSTVANVSDLIVKGDFYVASGTFTAGPGLLSMQGSRVTVATGAYYDAQTSTIGFDGGFNGKGWQGVSFHGGGSFNGARMVVSSITFLTNTTMTVLTDTVNGSTIGVAAGMRLRVDDLNLQPSGSARIRLRSDSPGLPWQLQLVAVSSVTGCIVSDSDASPGLTVRADDGRCSDQGGNTNWDFDPQLLTLFPGEAFTPGTAPGKSGAASQLTAGSTVTVTVQAYSSRYDPIFISSPVALYSDDPYATIPATLTLVGGSTSFAYSPRTAEPSPRPSVVSAAASFGSGGSTFTVIPESLQGLQVTLPGETPAPGRPGGKTGVSLARVKNVPFTVTVRAVDRYFNVISSITHGVALQTTASSSTLPAPAPLVAGSKLFTGLAMHVTGLFTLSVTDLTDPNVAATTSSVFGVSPPSVSSPTAAFHVPTGARVATLGGVVSGTASDSSSVERVALDLQDGSTGLHYDWNLGTFSSASAFFATATLASPLAPDTTWQALAPDSVFVNGRRYVFTASIDDPTGFTGAASSTFTFDRSSLDFGLKDGQGTAAVLPVSTAGCVVVVATLTYTVGASSIAPGGAVAVRAPDGWTVALGTSAAYPPPFGYWHAASTSAAFATARLSVSTPSLGAGWLLLEASTSSAQAFLPGQRVVFTYAGRPPLSAAGRGVQSFPLLARGDGAGSLQPIAAFPQMTLAAGVEPVLVFADPAPLSLATLQQSPTMQLSIEDRCGNPNPGVSSGTVALSLAVNAPGGPVADPSAEIRNVGGVLITTLFVSSGAAASPQFSVRTATAGPPELQLRASGFLSGALVAQTGVDAVRLVRLTTAPLAFAGVAAGTAPLPSGTTSAALSAADPQGVLARIAFRLGDPGAEWDLTLSTDPGTFGGPVLRASGRGEAGRTFVVTWDGVDRVSDPPRYAAPGHYRARLRSGGTAFDASVEAVVPDGASYTGNLGARGAGAFVRAAGPGAADGAFAVATSTGWFQLRGVRPGQGYLLTASTVSSAGGRLVALSTTVAAAPAAAPWLDLGTLSLPATGLLRVAVVSPVPAPRELVGAFIARGADGGVAASGPLRFSSGSASSDDAGPLFGRAASTWSAAALAAGTWTLEVDVPELRLSTAAPVTVAAGGVTDARLLPAKRGAVLGYVVLPSTSALGSLVSVEARLSGAEEPAAVAGVFVSSVPPAVVASSGAYGLFGLDYGTYTVTAVAAGFASSATTVYVSTGADVSLVLRLGLGASITGSVRVLGDSTGQGALFDVPVEARADGRVETARTRVRLGASASLSSGTFTLSGLSTGTWTLNAALPGYALSSSTGVRASAPGAAALDLTPSDARLRVDVAVPPLAGGACRTTQSYVSLGLSVETADGGSRFYPTTPSLAPVFSAPRTQRDAATGAFALLHCSSATLFSPPLPPGRVRVWAGFLDNGARAFGAAALASGATAALSLDLSGATTTVSGRVALTSEFTLSTRTPAGVPVTVTVSSAAGLNVWSPGPGPTLIGSAAPVPLRAFRAELRPLDPEGRVSTVTALMVSIAADGSYAFDGVSAGAWSLRVPGELDGDPLDGDEAADAVAALDVRAAPVVANLSLGRGAAVAGRLLAPGGTRLSRVLRVRLSGDDGSSRVAEASFADADNAAFRFSGLAPGRWRLSVEDPARPASWTAAPRLLEFGAAGLSGVDLRLESAGAIMGRLALGRSRPDGTQERLLLTAESAELLPPGFAITATALPPAWGRWSADAGLDADGRFLVAGLPAGSYELSLTAPAGLAPALVSGVSVAPGRASDPGLIVLRRAVTASGRLTDAATGLPAAGVAVSARPSSRASAAVRALSDAAGLWRIDGLDPDERWYDLTAAPRGLESGADAPAPYAPRRLRGVDASTGAVADFALSPAASVLRGRVTTPDGGRVFSSRGPDDATAPGAVLTLQRAGLPPEEDALADLVFRGGADGRFSIPSLATGSYRLGVSAEGYGSLSRAVSISTALTDLGDLLLPGGCALAGALRRPDGAPPTAAEVRAVAAATPDLNEFVWGSISREASGAGVAYRVGGLRTGRTYRLILFTGEDEPVVPPGGSAFVFTSSAEVRGFDAVARPPRPSVAARAERANGRVTVAFGFSRALRLRVPADSDPSLAATRVAGTGLLSGARLSADRRTLTVDYDPAAGESSFSVRARAAVAETDPDATDPAFPELTADATATFRSDVDAQQRAVLSNALGGALSVGVDGGRVILPRGAFGVDASSTVTLTFTRSTWNVAGAAPPNGLAAASPFFDVAVPAGVGTTLTRPARMVLPFAAGADPASLNLYWYNPGSGAYVLSPDALGQAPEVDAGARTYAVNVGHFSTYVLLPAGAAVIGGSAFAGGGLEAYAFPNPFDLRPKTVTTIHGGGSPVIRGTMLRVAVPADGAGAGRIRVFDAAGRLVRDISLGELPGGASYYVDWDGRNSAGADVASGLYLAVVTVGGKSKTVKLAVLK